MRTFIASAVIIAGFLIAQQWVAKTSEAQSHLPLAWASVATSSAAHAN